MADDARPLTLNPITPWHWVGVLCWFLVIGGLTFHSEWYGVLALIASVLPTIFLGNRTDRIVNPRLTTPVLAWALVLLAILRLLDLFPCDTGCQGGGYYQYIGPLPLMAPALALYLTLAIFITRDARRGGCCPWTIRIAYFLAGVSAFFLLVSSSLGLKCVFCHLCHLTSLVLLFWLGPFPSQVRWWHAVSWMLAGVLVLNAVYHHTPVADVVKSETATPETSLLQRKSAKAADLGRTYGDQTAPRTLEVIIDLTCGHCAEQYRPLMEALKPIIAAKRVRVVVRHLVRPSQAASGPAAELALAAAALHEHATALEILLPSNPDAGFAGLKARLEEVLDPVKLDGVLSKDRATITALLNDDQQRIGQLGVGSRTPSAVLINDGKVSKTWSGDLPIPAIIAALDGAL